MAIEPSESIKWLHVTTLSSIDHNAKKAIRGSNNNRTISEWKQAFTPSVAKSILPQMIPGEANALVLIARVKRTAGCTDPQSVLMLQDSVSKLLRFLYGQHSSLRLLFCLHLVVTLSRKRRWDTELMANGGVLLIMQYSSNTVKMNAAQCTAYAQR